MEFQTSDDIPFVLRGGDTKEIAMFNRIAAINRINFLIRKELPEFDLRDKSNEFRRCLDMELFHKYYIDGPKDKKIDEEFCQRTAQVCIEMENPKPNLEKDNPLSEAINIDPLY